MLGTLELAAGKLKAAKRFFAAALRDPTDNAVAQVGWASLRAPVPGPSEQHLALPFTYEARARAFTQSREWDAALNQGLLWLADEPFSSVAAEFASYMAAALRRFEDSAAVSAAGLHSNPGHPGLANNLAFALIHLKRFDEAASLLARPIPPNLDANRRAALSATRGLLAMRQGLHEEGRRLYEIAVDGATSAPVQALAALNWAREEERISDSQATRAFQRALELLSKLDPVARGEMTLWMPEAGPDDPARDRLPPQRLA